MGLVKAALGAASGVMGDQWKEYFYCSALPAEVLAVKGQKKVSGRSSNSHGADAGTLIHDAERNGRRRAVLVADKLLGVYVVDSLILGDLAAEGEALADGLEHLEYALSQLAGEDGRLGGGVVDVLAGNGAEVDDLALLDDEHALSVRDGDNGAVGDDVVIASVAAGGFLYALGGKNVHGDSLAIEILLPLIGEYAACGRERCGNKTHFIFSFRFMVNVLVSIITPISLLGNSLFILSPIIYIPTALLNMDIGYGIVS